MRSVLDRLLALESRVRGIPSRFAGGSAPTYSLIQIVGGNTVASATGWAAYGMGYITTAINQINPGEVSGGLPAQVNTYQTGLAYGLLNGVRIFVACRASATLGDTTGTTDLVGPLVLPAQAQVWCRRSVAVQLAGDPATTYPVWLPWRV